MSAVYRAKTHHSLNATCLSTSRITILIHTNASKVAHVLTLSQTAENGAQELHVRSTIDDLYSQWPSPLHPSLVLIILNTTSTTPLTSPQNTIPPQPSLPQQSRKLPNPALTNLRFPPLPPRFFRARILYPLDELGRPDIKKLI